MGMTYQSGKAADGSPARLPLGRGRIVNTSDNGFYRRRAKRGLDVVLVLVVAPVVLLVVGLLGLLVRLDGGPAFYTHERIGRDGSPFRLWKLRTMVVDADECLEVHLRADPEARDEWDRDQKLKRDPRVTPLGRILRRTSLDELPQLVNILAGDMSLVGPRPILPSQIELYPGQAYFTLRPGLTGLWQVTSRNDGAFAQRSILDSEYAQKVSLLTDLRLLFSTFRVVLMATGH